MKSFTRAAAIFAGWGLLAGTGAPPTSAAAQTPTVAATQEALVGNWVRVLDTDTAKKEEREGRWGEWAGRQVAHYLTLNNDSTSQAHIEVNGVRDSTAGGGWVIYMVEGAGDRGRWTVRGDTLRAGRDGRYLRYRVVLEGSTLALITAGYTDSDHTHHEQCARVFTRVEAGRPLPAPSAKDGCQTVAGALPPTPLKATELVGTWARLDSMAFGADTGQGRPGICGKPGRCRMIKYDTLVFQPDSVLRHKVIDVYPVKPNGESDPTVVSNAQWWIAADTLWVQYVYAKGDIARGQAVSEIRIEDDGQYLVFGSRLYRRVTPAAP